ncbi:MAG: aldo/keto reductase family oxidoreductase [Ruminococcaceae bacterium]|nr:aldo/keto reductase family oxidoreductase [Oscillospiraceae bacterium]
MKKISVGKSFDASAVVMGCMRIDGAKEAPDKIINTALDLGIDYFDHADIYGGGRCEEIFGDFLAENKSIRDKITIQTKCAIRSGFFDYSKEHILNSVENSLKRLRCDYLDVLLLHRPDTLMEPEEVAEAFSLLESSGKVKHFGVSNHNPMQIELLKTAVEQPLIINQLQLSITESGMITSGLNVNMKNDESFMHDGSVLEYSRIKGITIQAWSPFQQGFFKGVFLGDYEKYPELNKVIDELAEKYNVQPISIASAWILRHPANIQLISGSMNTERIKAICAGADIVLSREEWYSIYRAAGFRLP